MVSKVTIYLVRHGQTIMNTLHHMQGWYDSPLTHLGVANAKALGRGFSDIQFDAVYCSGLRRTYQTAQLILSAKRQENLQIKELDGLNEMCFGSFEAMDETLAWQTISSSMGFNPQTNQLDEALFEGKITMQQIYQELKKLDQLDMAETWETVEERVFTTIKGITKLEQSQSSRKLLVVSHGNSIATFLMRLGCKEIPQKPIENLSVSEIVYDGQFAIKTVADMSYMEKGKSIHDLRIQDV